MTLPDSEFSTDELASAGVEDAWGLLTKHLELFLEAWSGSDAPPTLADFLPIDDDGLRRFVLVELIKVDLEYRYRAGGAGKRLEDYVHEFPTLVQIGDLPVDLIHEEYHVRRSAGEKVLLSEYYERFPQQAGQLGELLQLDSPTVTRALCESRGSIDVNTGDKLDDFDLLLQLGKGAFATVFLARQNSMQRLVALKVSTDHGIEPQTLAQLDHPNIVRVYDQRSLSQRAMRLLYMQYVPGGTLQAVIRTSRSLPLQQRSGNTLLAAVEAESQRSGQSIEMQRGGRHQLTKSSWPEVVCRLGAQLADALDHAHSRGVFHRDVKPANVLLAADGTAKLADFNVSFSADVRGSTPAAYFGGSLPYMSPEHLEAFNPMHERSPDDVDGRSDIYSLGVVLWELLHGEMPFLNEQLAGNWQTTLEQLTARRRNEQHEFSNISTDHGYQCLRQVLVKCLQSDPGRRYSDAAQLARDLVLCLHPRASRLLQQPVEGKPSFLRTWCIPAVIFAALIPNALAGVFGYYYNKAAIIDHLGDQVRTTFWNVQIVINAIAFPLGTIIALWMIWPVIRRSRPPKTVTDGLDVVHLASIRGRALHLGHYIALVGIVEWSAAGLLYPISMQLITGRLNVATYLNFGASHVLCGLIAAVYPFFLITLISVRALYPTLIGSATTEGDLIVIRKVGRRTSAYLFLASSIPAISVAMLVVAGLLTESHGAMALFVLSVVGVVGFGLAFVVYRTLRKDLSALALAASPIDSISAATESISEL